jgi:uncharacterized membrane protein YphA (DoxX/SURF4 family)
MSELVTSAAPARGRTYWIRIIAYWAFTLFVAYEMVAGGLWDLLRIEYVRVVMTHLGYPLYLLFIIGVWKIPCAVTLLVPRFLRLKEWAYAGAFFNYTGAVASHLAVGDRAKGWMAPIIFAAFTLASWTLRPPERRLASAGPTIETRYVAWVLPILIVVVLLVVSLVSLPQGPPPQ